MIKTVQSQCIEELQNEDLCFKPFIFDSIVSLPGKAEDEQSIKILRDTGGSQSFILSDVLPLSKKYFCHLSTLVQGVEMSYVPAPLHCVCIKSLVCGVFTSTAFFLR